MWLQESINTKKKMGINKLNNLLKYVRLHKLFIMTVLALLLFATSSSARLLRHCNNMLTYLPGINNELNYSFKVPEKLTGSGEIKLHVYKNKITGIATGLGKITQCNIDFHTKIIGKLNCSNSCVDVVVSGTGDPLIPLPGKVKFSGPLMGFIQNEKLYLSGTVEIKGKLARFAGFKKQEELEIEIPFSKQNLASL